MSILLILVFAVAVRYSSSRVSHRSPSRHVTRLEGDTERQYQQTEQYNKALPPRQPDHASSESIDRYSEISEKSHEERDTQYENLDQATIEERIPYPPAPYDTLPDKSPLLISAEYYYDITFWQERTRNALDSDEF